MRQQTNTKICAEGERDLTDAEWLEAVIAVLVHIIGVRCMAMGARRTQLVLELCDAEYAGFGTPQVLRKSWGPSVGCGSCAFQGWSQH